MRNTIIFDLDGTLLDTLDDLADAANKTLEHFGFEKKSREFIRMAVGNGIKKLVERILPNGLETRNFDEIFAWFKNYYTNNCMVKTREYDGISAALENLSKIGCTLAIVSNKNDEAVKRLSDYYFKKYIKIAVGQREGIRKKPAPDSVFEVMKEAEVKPKECIYVGDSDVDVDTAKNAGIPCIGVAWGFRGRKFLEEHGAKKIIDKPLELIDAIK